MATVRRSCSSAEREREDIDAMLAVVAGVPDGRRATLPDQTHAVDPAVLAPVLIDFFGSAG